MGSSPIARSQPLQNRAAFYLERAAVNELLNFFNLDTDETLEESLRLAIMFKSEMDEASQGYLEMLRLTIDPQSQSPAEIEKLVQEAINAALVTGMRAYRSWIQSAGVNVRAIEASTGKDIPPVNIKPNSHWLQ